MDVVRDGWMFEESWFESRLGNSIISPPPPPQQLWNPQKKSYWMSSGDLCSGVQRPKREPDHSGLMLNLRITGALHSLLHIPSWRIQKQIYLEAAETRFLRNVKEYTKLDKIRSEVMRKGTGDLWNTIRERQIQTELDQPSWKNGQHQTSETPPQLQT